MAVRVRTDGTIVCAALRQPEPGDVYVNDAVHYTLSVERRLLVTEPANRHVEHGLWWWRDEVPDGVEIENW